MAVPSIFEGLSLTTIESQIAGVQVIISDAVPDEAIISNGCVRIDLNKDLWVNKLSTLKSTEIKLTENSKAYNIDIASKKLCEYYLEKIK